MSLSKKHRLLKPVSLASVVAYLLIYYAGMLFWKNRAKITVFSSVLLCFFISASFSYEGVLDSKETLIPFHYEESTVSDLYIYETDEDPMTEEVIDDLDVMEGYENSEFEILEENETYSIEEILKENETDLSAETSQSQLEIQKDDWRLLLINKQNPIPDEYSFTLGTIKGSMKCDERIIPDLLEMLQGAKEDGISLVICSPYRDLNRQKVLFDRKVSIYKKKGMSHMQAYQSASRTVTVPGASEHQVGLALDIVCSSYTALNEGFGETQAGTWLAKNSYIYGFILRYPYGKEEITGIQYEPWHFRYVGKDAAKEITDNNLTLEEYVSTLK